MITNVPSEGIFSNVQYEMMSGITDYLGNNRAVARAYFPAIPRFDRSDSLAGKYPISAPIPSAQTTP